MDELDRRVLRFIGKLCLAPVVLPLQLARWCLRLTVRLLRLPFTAANQAREAGLRKIESEKRRLDSDRRAAAQLRRVEARSESELLFNLHEADIGPRFNRQMLQDYMNRYMGDAESPEVVERRGKELRALIEKHRAAVGLRDRPQSIDDLARWFLEEKSRLERLGIEEELREEHLAMLQIRYAELSQEILESARP